MSQSKSSRGKKQDQQAERRAFSSRKPSESVVITPRPRFVKAAAPETSLVTALAGIGKRKTGSRNTDD